jgi:hypothetical protein
MTTRPALVSLLTGAALLLAACSDITGPVVLENMRGVITEVRTEGINENTSIAKILIEEDPSIPMEEWMKLRDESPEKYGYEKVLWVVTADTELLRQEEDETLVPIELDELHVGAEVRAFKWAEFDAYVDTGLPMAYAGRIILIEPAS